MANIQKLEERMEELALRIEEQKEKAHTYLGEEIFKLLGIPYEHVGTKKEAKEIAELIYANMEENPFSEKEIYAKEEDNFPEESTRGFNNISEANVE